MKKSLFVAPIVAVSLLASCGGGSKPATLYKLHFEGTNCVLLDESKNPITSDKDYEANSTITLYLKGDAGYKIPNDTNVKVSLTDTKEAFSNYEYHNNDGLLKITKMTANITINANSDEVDPYFVTEQEFNDACGFKNVQYLQVTEIREEPSERSEHYHEMSPTVYYNRLETNDPMYREEFVKKNADETYYWWHRENKEGNYIFQNNASGNFFVTPENKSINVLKQFTEAGISFNSFTYNPVEGNYTATIEQPGPEGPMEFVVTLKFLSKKLISYGGTIASQGFSQITTYTYEEKTPTPPELKKWYEYDNWWDYCSCGVEGTEAIEADIERKVNLTVNGINQEVRLIDVDKDVDENNNKIHCTFEFVNVLSDENGYSLATYWNDTNSSIAANYDYRDSSIRKALNGTANDVNWFRFYGKPDGQEDSRNLKFATEPQYKKSVLNMLPAGLSSVLKTPSKFINIFNSELATPSWEEQTINDKIFLLSPAEMGRTGHEAEETRTTAYSYYDSATDGDRIKKQIKGSDNARTRQAYNVEGKFDGFKNSWAGYNDEDSNKGCFTYLRSPSTEFYEDAWRIHSNGSLYNEIDKHVCTDALPVAPAFCI